MKSVPYFIIVILFCLIALQWIEGNKREDAHKLIERRLEAKADSLDARQKQATIEALNALTRANISEQRVKVLLQAAINRDKRHEKDLNRPLVRLSDDAIDSATARLYGQR